MLGVRSAGTHHTLRTGSLAAREPVYRKSGGQCAHSFLQTILPCFPQPHLQLTQTPSRPPSRTLTPTYYWRWHRTSWFASLLSQKGKELGPELPCAQGTFYITTKQNFKSLRSSKLQRRGFLLLLLFLIWTPEPYLFLSPGKDKDIEVAFLYYC